MKKHIIAVSALLLIVTLAGCGGGGDSVPPIVITQIVSDPAFDGDIARDPVLGTFTVTQGNAQGLLAGIDPANGVEFRAFLDFPLGGVGGVPFNASVVRATLDIFINKISPQPLIGSLPIRVDLVSFQPPTLIGTDFDRTLQPALATTIIFPPITQSDLNLHVPIDVTFLMQEVQRLGLTDFQVRIMADFGVLSGLIEINDTTGANRSILAPLLEVEFF
jgi:hypothetical protein